MSLLFYGTRVDHPESACPGDPADVVAKVTQGKSRVIAPSRKSNPRAANHWTSAFVVHTSSGTAIDKCSDTRVSFKDWLLAKYFASTPRAASCHAILDTDGSVIQIADADRTTWSAMQVNPFVDSCELMQDGHSLTELQLAAFVAFMDAWTYHTGIPRIIPWRDGKPYAGMLTRALAAYGAGRALCGIYGHRNVWGVDKAGHLGPYRGPGDPSDTPFQALAAAGYLKFDMEAGEDVAYWKDVQLRFNLVADGIPGPKLRRALLTAGNRPGGMLVTRPGDVDRGPPRWSLRLAA